jgi:hypothetical protein
MGLAIPGPTDVSAAARIGLPRPFQISLWTPLPGSESPAIAKHERKPLHLRRIDPSQKLRRFYCLTIQPTLFAAAAAGSGLHGVAVLGRFQTGT